MLKLNFTYIEILKTFSSVVERQMKKAFKSNLSAHKDSLPPNLLAVWDKIQNHLLKSDVERVGEFYAREDFERDLKTLFLHTSDIELF